MEFRHIRAALAAAAVLCAGVLAAPAQAEEPVLKFATEGTFPPFEFYDAKAGKVVGFEIDLAWAVCERMGRKCELEPYKFDAILPALVTGTIDFAAAGFAVTPERAKKVLFTDSFYTSGVSITVPKGNPAGIKTFVDLKGKRLAAQLGSVSHDVAKTIPQAKVRAFDSASDAMLDMLSGNADAVLNSAPATDYMLLERPSLGKRVDRLEVITKTTDMAMVVPKDKPELQKAMNEALAAIRADGTYEKIAAKWFGKAH